MNELLRHRLLQERNDLFKYSKYIFNGHLIGFLFMLSFVFVYYYMQWLQTITVFQGKLLVSICMIMIVVLIFMQKLILLVKPADIVFLSSREQDFKKVFKLTRLPSLFFTITWILLIDLIILPIFVTQLNYQLFVSSILMQLLLVWIIRIVYEQQFYQYNIIRLRHYVLLFLISISLLVLPIWYSMYYQFIVLILLVSAILLSKKQNIYALNWEAMIIYEQQRKQRQYQLLALFVDIPQLSIKVHRRKYFDSLIRQLSAATDNMYYYLFVRSFFRQENTIFLIGRLMIFTMLLMSVFKYDVLILSIGIMSSYLVLIQLRTLIKQYDYHLWFQIYPQSNKFKYTAFHKLIRQIMLAVVSIMMIYIFIILATKWYVIIYVAMMLIMIVWLERNKKDD